MEGQTLIKKGGEEKEKEEEEEGREEGEKSPLRFTSDPPQRSFKTATSKTIS